MTTTTQEILLVAMSLTVSHVAMDYLSNAGNTLALTGIKSKYTYILFISVSPIIAALMHERIVCPVYVSTKIGLSENI